MLESLVATALFTVISSLVLTEINRSRYRQYQYLQEEEAYQVAKMAMQTGQDQLHLNGQEIEVIQTSKGVKIYHKKELLLEIEEK